MLKVAIPPGTGSSGGKEREIMGPLPIVAQPRGLPAVPASPFLPSLPLPASLVLLGVCLTSEHRDIPVGDDGSLAREVECARVGPLILGGEARQVEDLEIVLAEEVGSGAVCVLRDPNGAKEHVLLCLTRQAELVLNGQVGGILMAAV